MMIGIARRGEKTAAATAIAKDTSTTPKSLTTRRRLQNGGLCSSKGENKGVLLPDYR
jgi:hypothetical protein